MAHLRVLRLSVLPALLLTASLAAQGQPKPAARKPAAPRLPAQPVDTARVYDYVEQMPQPSGGMAGLMQYLGRNFRYPLTCDYTADTKILVAFTVRADGRLSNVRVDQTTHPSLAAEALRVIRRMPPWTAGRQNGQPVKVACTVPITCILLR